MVLLRHLVLFCMKYNICVRARHLAGKLNIYADLLSRSQVQRALELDPGLDRQPLQVPLDWSLPRLLQL